MNTLSYVGKRVNLLSKNDFKYDNFIKSVKGIQNTLAIVQGENKKKFGAFTNI